MKPVCKGSKFDTFYYLWKMESQYENKLQYLLDYFFFLSYAATGHWKSIHSLNSGNNGNTSIVLYDYCHYCGISPSFSRLRVHSSWEALLIHPLLSLHIEYSKVDQELWEFDHTSRQRGKECTENVDAVFQLFSQYLSELIYGVLCRTRKKKQEVFLLFWLPASTEKVNLFSFPKHYKSGRIQNLTSFLLLYVAMDWTWAVAAQALQWRFSKRPVAKRLSAAVVLHCSLPQYCWSNRFCSYTGLRLTRGCHARLHLYRQGMYRHLIPKRKTKEQTKRQPSK